MPSAGVSPEPATPATPLPSTSSRSARPSACTGIEGYGVGQFGQFAPSSIAVNSTGDHLHRRRQLPEGRAQQFVPSGGGYTPSVFAPTITRPRQVAVGAGDHVFFTREFPEGATAECPNGSPSFSEYRIVEVDSSGAVQGTEVGMTCARVSTYFGLAVNKSTGELYIPSYDYSGPEIPVRGVRILTESQLPTATIDDVTPTTAGAVVSGTINPNGPPASIPHPVTTSYQLQYKLTSSSEWTLVRVADRHRRRVHVGPGHRQPRRSRREHALRHPPRGDHGRSACRPSFSAPETLHHLADPAEHRELLIVGRHGRFRRSPRPRQPARR